MADPERHVLGATFGFRTWLIAASGLKFFLQ